jgi:hypothetical protein
MAKVSTKRKTDIEPAMTGLSFPQIGEDDPVKAVDKAEEKTQADQLAALQTQIGELMGRLDTAERTNMALMTSPPRSEPTVTQPQAVKLDNLPDPGLDPEGYAREIMKRTQESVTSLLQSQQQQREQQNSQGDRVKNLWNAFNETYEDLADDPDKVEFAAQKVAKRAKARGLDVERYMFGAQEKFMADVAKEVEKTFGKPKAAEDTEEDTPTRTAIFGGNEGGSRLSQVQAEQGGDMLAELHEIQKKSGLY